MDRKLLGRWGEQAAADYLKKQKYKIIGQNHACRFGEVDLIAENKAYVVFVEVKLRKNAAFAEAREFVTAAKRRRIIAAARHWLAANPTRKQPRFDVIEIYGADGRIERLNHIENAFGADYF